MWVYKWVSRSSAYQVGYYMSQSSGASQFVPIESHPDRASAANAVHYLNGGNGSLASPSGQNLTAGP